jgi:DNA-directed RNA polymerase subunit E'/Rpb7
MGKKRNREEKEQAGEAGGDLRHSKEEKKRRKKEAKKLRKHKEKERGKALESADNNVQDYESLPSHLASLPAAISKSHDKPVFFEKRLEMTVALYPIDLGNVVGAVENSLRSLLLRYSDQMGGALLAFSDTTILNGGQGRILNDLPHVHYSVTSKALVFQPSVGGMLVGSVKESFPSHLSLTVYHYFNASIPASALYESGFSFDKVSLEWLTGDSRPVTEGSDIQFLVHSLHESGGVISLEGINPSVRKL